jgi:GNAT superfamily N-acetyltransferase
MYTQETEGLCIPDAVAAAGVAAVLQPQGAAQSAARYFVAECAGGGAQHTTLVGQLMITQEWSDWRAAWVWWIQSVYVRPEWRGRGIFKQLYRHVRDAAQSEGVAGLRLYADDANANAHAAVRIGRLADLASLPYVRPVPSNRTVLTSLRCMPTPAVCSTGHDIPL